MKRIVYSIIITHIILTGLAMGSFMGDQLHWIPRIAGYIAAWGALIALLALSYSFTLSVSLRRNVSAMEERIAAKDREIQHWRKATERWQKSAKEEYEKGLAQGEYNVTKMVMDTISPAPGNTGTPKEE
jgi:hypothetical protein